LMKNFFRDFLIISIVGTVTVGALVVLTDEDLRGKVKDQILSLLDASGKMVASVKKISEDFSDKAEPAIDHISEINSQWKTVKDQMQG
jgi:hypothetical protein